jgi:hypothetical protein
MTDNKPDAPTAALTSSERPAREQAQPIQQIQPLGAAAPGETDETMVSVKPIKSFRYGDGMRHAKVGDDGKVEPGEAFEVPRHDAASLHSNGLVDYASESDETAAHAAAVKAAADGVKTRRASANAGIADDAKSTPLRPHTMNMRTSDK